MCPELKEVSTGDTLSAWHLASVGFFYTFKCVIFFFNLISKNLGLASCVCFILTVVALLINAGAVFSESPYEEGYDVTVGTSERGSNVDQTTLSPFK